MSVKHPPHVKDAIDKNNKAIAQHVETHRQCVENLFDVKYKFLNSTKDIAELEARNTVMKEKGSALCELWSIADDPDDALDEMGQIVSYASRSATPLSVCFDGITRPYPIALAFKKGFHEVRGGSSSDCNVVAYVGEKANELVASGSHLVSLGMFLEPNFSANYLEDEDAGANEPTGKLETETEDSNKPTGKPEMEDINELIAKPKMEDSDSDSILEMLAGGPTFAND